METNSSSNKRIAKNTMMLYFRQILILLVSLYTVRVVLNTLGVEDYGIYSVVGGIVALFSFLSTTMSSATQRFFSFFIGQNDKIKLKQVFSVNLIIYIGIAIIAFILLETLGLWFVKEQLKVPPERYDAAIFIYHFSVFTFLVTIAKTPFVAMLIAHENMQIYAYISIVEAVMKLVVVFLLIYLPWDNLETYGVLLFAVAVINTVMYGWVSIKKYDECQFKRLYWDKKIFNELIDYTGWTLFGQISTVFRNQGVTVLLNQTFNPIVVASKAIATNISNQINVFSNSFNVGLYPPIIKSYAAKEKEYMFSLIFNGSKITFFLMWVFALPFFIEMETVLQVWLKEPPAYAVLFTRLALIEVLINSVSLPLTTAARAPGRMKVYELSLGAIQIAIFFLSWIVLKSGGAAYSIFIVAIIANLLMFFIRLFIVNKLIQLPVILFMKNTVMPLLGIISTSLILTLGFDYFMPKGLFFSGLTVLVSVLISSLSMYFIGLNKLWRNKVNEVISNRFNKL